MININFEYYGNIDEKTINKSKELQEKYNFKKVRLMPDAHYSELVPVGFVGEIDKPVPKLITPDIGCGVTTVIYEACEDFQLKDETFNNIREKLDYRENNRSITESEYLDIMDFQFRETLERVVMDKDHLLDQFGQIGGGNHFAEIGIKDRYIYITVHSGSRNFGFKVWKYWTDYVKNHRNIKNFRKDYVENIKLIKQGKEIENSIKQFNYDFRNLEHLIYKEDIQKFMKDINNASNYAKESRASTIFAIFDLILKQNPNKNFKLLSPINSEHNMYYQTNNSFVLRKGAIHSKPNERMVIPMNMKEGILIYKLSKDSTKDLINSAPHGLGRIMSRTEAKEKFNEKDLIEEMKGINSNKDKFKIIDESPKSYKNSKEFKKIMEENFDILEEVPPIFNYKVSN